MSGSEAPIGLILCAGKKREQIELLELGNAGIHVAEYLTALLPKETMRDKFRKAIELAQKRVVERGEARLGENIRPLRNCVA